MKIVVAFMVLISVAAASAQTKQVYEKLAYQKISQYPAPAPAKEPVKIPVPPKKKP